MGFSESIDVFDNDVLSFSTTLGTGSLSNVITVSTILELLVVFGNLVVAMTAIATEPIKTKLLIKEKNLLSLHCSYTS